VYKKVQVAESDQNQKKLGKNKQKSESLGWDPFQRVSIFFFRFCCCFFVGVSKVLPSVGHFKEAGMNHRQSCQSAFGSAVKHLKISSYINHGETALPGAVVPFLFCWHCLTALLNFSFFCFARNN
jgi:hypothetical protein